ncbi:MAG: hypothetical protein ACJ8KU_06695 [Chthoniobacterales bacterium]
MNTRLVVLTGLLITHELTDEAVGWFSKLRNVVDKLLVFVDKNPAPHDLAKKLQVLDARVVFLSNNGGAIYRADLTAILAECRGDWILKVDYDEELSPEWHDPSWRENLRSEYTHFWCARRWMVTHGRYIACAPWWPDWQLRLFRNLPDQITFPTRLHENIQIAGPGGYLRTLAIHHHHLHMAPRSIREAKAAAYERERPGHGLGFFYLPENYAPPELALPIGSDADPPREILRMPRLGDDEVGLLTIEASAAPSDAGISELFWVRVKVRNNSEHTVGVGAPFPVNLSYHWFDRRSREAVVFDGMRTPVLPGIAAGGTGMFRLFVIAPSAPAEYLLRITLVQEGARWLDQSGSPTVQDFFISVHLSS